MNDVKIKKCKYCGRVYLKEWSKGEMSEDDFLNYYFHNVLKINNANFKASGDYFNRKVSYNFLDENGETVSGQFFVKTSYHSCPSCSKKRGNYFEAVIQLRGGSSKFLEVLGFVDKLIESEGNSDIFITRIDKRREGYDLYVSDKEFSKIISKRIIEKYGGYITESNSLVGRKEGRDIYRFTYSVRLPSLFTFDMIKLWGKRWIIEKIHGNEITVVDLDSWDEKHIKLSDAEQGIILQHKEDYKVADVIYTQDNSSYIISPFDLREKAIRRIDDKKTVLVADLNGELIVIPPWI